MFLNLFFVSIFFYIKEYYGKPVRNDNCFLLIAFSFLLVAFLGAVVVEWLSSWLAEQEVRGSIPRLAT